MPLAASLLDLAFFALSDPTRRNILQRLGQQEATVSELAAPLHMSLPAVSKHLRVLEKAGLLSRRVAGRSHFLRVNAQRLRQAQEWIEQQRKFWEGSFDQLEAHLQRTLTPPTLPRKKS